MEQEENGKQNAELANSSIQRQQTLTYEQTTSQEKGKSFESEGNVREALEVNDSTSSQQGKPNEGDNEQTQSDGTDQETQEQVTSNLDHTESQDSKENDTHEEENQMIKPQKDDNLGQNAESQSDDSQPTIEDLRTQESSSDSEDSTVTREKSIAQQATTEEEVNDSNEGNVEENTSQSDENIKSSQSVQPPDTEESYNDDLGQAGTRSSTDNDSRRSSLKSSDSSKQDSTGNESSEGNADSQKTGEEEDQRPTSQSLGSVDHSIGSGENASGKGKGERLNKNSRARSRKTVSADDARPQTTKSQIEADLLRTRKQLIRTAKSVTRPLVKPYSPDIFNDLSPYYNRYMVDTILNNLDLSHKSWRKYGQRSTALGIVSPQKSLSMDGSLEAYTYSKVHDQLWKRKVWSKNQSGKGNEFGSTLLPPLPTINVAGPNNPKYQSLKMSYDEVPQFRRDMNHIIKEYERRKIKEDFQRVRMDWKRMNLSELQELPSVSRYHVSKAITTYLGTSKGSLRAVEKLTRENHVYADDIETA